MWIVCLSEAGDDSGISVSVAQRCSDEATTVDVKCTSLVSRDDSATATPTSGHVTANEHDHMVSSTIHSDGRFTFDVFCNCVVIIWLLLVHDSTLRLNQKMYRMLTMHKSV